MANEFDKDKLDIPPPRADFAIGPAKVEVANLLKFATLYLEQRAGMNSEECVQMRRVIARALEATPAVLTPK